MKLFKNKNGFSFVELLVAITILAITIPSFFTFLNSQIYKTKLNIDMTNALLLAENKLEFLLQEDYNSSDLSDTNTSNNSNLNTSINLNSIQNNETSYISSTFDHSDTPQIINNTKFYILWNIAESTTIKTTNKFKLIGVIIYWIYQGKGHKVYLMSIKREE